MMLGCEDGSVCFLLFQSCFGVDFQLLLRNYAKRNFVSSTVKSLAAQPSEKENILVTIKKSDAKSTGFEIEIYRIGGGIWSNPPCHSTLAPSPSYTSVSAPFSWPFPLPNI